MGQVRDQHAHAQRADDEHQAQPHQLPEAAGDGNVEEQLGQPQQGEQVEQAHQQVGDDLAQHQLPGLDRRDDQLLHGALLALLDDCQGREQQRLHLQDDGDQAGDHEQLAVAVGVVERLEEGVNRVVQARGGRGQAELLHQDILRNHLADGAELELDGLHVGGVGGAIDVDLHRGGLVGIQLAPEIFGDQQPHVHVALVDQGQDLVLAQHVIGHLEIVAGSEIFDIAAAGVGFREIGHRHGDAGALARDAKAEQDQQHGRQGQDQAQRARVAPDVIQFLTHDGPQTFHGYAPWSAACAM